MLAAIASAVSGLRAATLRLEASASNVANIGSRGALPPGAPQAYQPVRVEQTSMTRPGGAGGGTMAAVRNVSPAWRAAYDPGAGFAGASGMVAEPNVDLIGEALEQASAEAAFIANLRTLQTAQDMVRWLYELTD